MDKLLQLIKHENNSIVLDDSRIDLWDIPELDIPDWQPTIKIQPFEELTRIYIDIETTGKDATINQIKYIGVKIKAPDNWFQYLLDISDNYKYYYGTDEHLILNEFMLDMNSLFSDGREIVVSFYNGFKFDLPFISDRAVILGLDSVFNPSLINGLERRVRKATASFYGQPFEYIDYSAYKLGSIKRHHNVSIVDAMIMVLEYDFVARTLESFSLKNVPYDLKLEGFQGKKTRVELTYPELLKAYEIADQTNDHSLVLGYLRDDLDATEAVSEFFIPRYYYQKLILPDEKFCKWNLQRITRTGNGTKWNAIVSHYYFGDDYYEDNDIEPDDRVNYEGGYTKGYAGIYRNVAKIDVASLYPSIMLTYGIYARNKDEDMYVLSVLKYLRNERLRLKQLGKQGDKQAKSIEAAMKVMINSAYGGLATNGIAFNDFEAASLVTAIGRKVIKTMMKTCEDSGGIVIESDCLTGETLVLCQDGIKPIKELAGTEQIILNGAGKWVKVPFLAKDKPDQIWEITFKRWNKTYTVRCNAQHKFYVNTYNGHYKGLEPVRTEVQNIKIGSVVRSNLAPKPDTNSDYRKGITHGIIYGDGNYYKSGFMIQLVGSKSQLRRYLPQAKFNSRGVLPSGKLWVKYSIESDVDLKRLPSLNCSNNYLLGFIRGLIATDGSVDSYGNTDISGDLETVEFIDKIAMRCGFMVSRINLSSPEGHTAIGVTTDLVITQTKDNYKVFFEMHSVTKDDLLRTYHRLKYRKPSCNNAPWKVVDIKTTNDYEIMYCPIEPETHQFTLYNGLISSQTDGLLYSAKTSEDIDIIYQACQDALPETINLELEMKAEYIYIPPKTKTTEKGEGQTKNYLIFTNRDKVKATGRFRNRNKSWLDKNLHIELLKKLLYGGKDQFYSYYRNLLKDLVNNSGIFSPPYKAIKIRRKVRSNENKIFKLAETEPGLIFREVQELADNDPNNPLVCEYYKSERPSYSAKTKKRLKNPEIFYSAGMFPPSYSFYNEQIEETYKEISRYLNMLESSDK